MGARLRQERKERTKQEQQEKIQRKLEQGANPESLTGTGSRSRKARRVSRRHWTLPTPSPGAKAAAETTEGLWSRMRGVGAHTSREIGGALDQLRPSKWPGHLSDFKPLSRSADHVMGRAFMLPFQAAWAGGAGVWRGLSGAVPSSWVEGAAGLARDAGVGEKYVRGALNRTGASQWGYLADPFHKAAQGIGGQLSKLGKEQGLFKTAGGLVGEAGGLVKNLAFAPIAMAGHVVGNLAGAAVGGVANGAVNTAAAAARALPGVATELAAMGKGTYDMVKGAYNSPLVTREITNFKDSNTLLERLTGRQVHGPIQDLAVAGVLGISAAKGIFEGVNEMRYGRSEAAPLAGKEDFGAMMPTSAKTKWTHKGADGDLVFALHKLRRGG